MTLNSVVLPAPLGPIRPLTAAAADRQVDIEERLDPAEAHAHVLDRAQPTEPTSLARRHGPAPRALPTSPRRGPRYRSQKAAALA